MSDLIWTRADLTVIAECDHCQWTYTLGRDGINSAKRHARQNPGHTVVAERVTRWLYEKPGPAA